MADDTRASFPCGSLLRLVLKADYQFLERLGAMFARGPLVIGLSIG